MKLSKIFTTSLIALCLSIPMAACDGGDDGGDADTTADTGNNETTGADTTDTTTDTTGGETGPSEDVDCSVFCVGYLTICVESGLSTEYPNNDACTAACEAWDQAGTNCRYQQVIEGACDQAGDMGSAC